MSHSFACHFWDFLVLKHPIFATCCSIPFTDLSGWCLMLRSIWSIPMWEHDLPLTSTGCLRIGHRKWSSRFLLHILSTVQDVRQHLDITPSFVWGMSQQTSVFNSKKCFHACLPLSPHFAWLLYRIDKKNIDALYKSKRKSKGQENHGEISWNLHKITASATIL